MTFFTEPIKFATPMRALHYKIRAWILQFIDLFYPLFRRFMTLQMFRYAACGGGNTLLSIVLYSLSYNFIIKKQVVDLGFIAFKPHVAAFILSFFVTFPIGFYLSMFVVFQGSFLRRRTQLVRYFMVAVACIFINYYAIRFFVEELHWYPTPSMIVTAGLVIAFSYFSQRYFSFRQPKVVTKAEQKFNF